MHVEPTCVAEMDADPHYDDLLAEYGLQKSRDLPSLKAAYLMTRRSRDNYAHLESQGMLSLFRAMHDNRLVGILSLFDGNNGSPAMIESLYVMDRYRRTGAGNALMETAKRFCKIQGKELIMGAAPGSVLDRILCRSKSATLISKMYYIIL